MNLNTMKLTRRSFVKGTAAVTAASALGTALAYKPVEAFANTPNAAVQGENGEAYGHCRMCMLCGSCSFVATMKDGVVVNIEGDPDRANRCRHIMPSRQKRHHERIQSPPHQSTHEANES